MLGSLSSLTISFSCTTPFSSDTGLSPVYSCRISPHYTISAKSDRNSTSREIVTPARWSAQYCPPFLRKKKNQSAIEMYKVDIQYLWLSGCITGERILVLFSQELVFLDHCFLFFWLLLGGSFPQAAWKRESRKAVGPPGKSNGIITSDTNSKWKSFLPRAAYVSEGLGDWNARIN